MNDKIFYTLLLVAFAFIIASVEGLSAFQERECRARKPLLARLELILPAV